MDRDLGEDMEKMYKFCQSCGMPIKTAEDSGTNADGSQSGRFCSHCFQGGKFTLPDLTLDQMKKRVKGKLKEFGIPGFLTWIFTRNIPKLQRWQPK